jgi:hypothetical protein
VFWAAFFIEENDSYYPGAAVWSLFAGAAVVIAAGVVVLTRTPIGTRPALANDWRIGAALVALGAVVVAMATVSEAESPWIWLENNAELIVLGVAGLALTLTRLRRDQALAGLVAVSVLGYWLLYYMIRDYVEQYSGIEPSERMTEILCVVVTLLACFAAQATTVLRPAATTSEPR